MARFEGRIRDPNSESKNEFIPVSEAIVKFLQRDSKYTNDIINLIKEHKSKRNSSKYGKMSVGLILKQLESKKIVKHEKIPGRRDYLWILRDQSLQNIVLHLFVCNLECEDQ